MSTKASNNPQLPPFQILIQQVPRAELDKAGGGAVGAGEPLRLGDCGVHDEMDPGGLGQDGAENRGGAYAYAGELPQPLGRGE